MIQGTPIGEVLAQRGSLSTIRSSPGAKPTVRPAVPTLPEAQEQWLLAVTLFERAFRATFPPPPPLPLMPV